MCSSVLDYELFITTYVPDTTASALIIYDNVEMEYNYDPGISVIVLTSLRTTKIKILKEDGISFADFMIDYHVKNDKLMNISGNTYNKVDGKTVKTKLSKDYIFDEVVKDRYHVKKISFKDVKVGSIIELKYKKQTPYIVPDTWYFQRSVPVKHSLVKLVYPTAYNFNFEQRGGDKILNRQDTGKPVSFFIGSDNLSLNTVEYIFEGNDLAAIKDDVPFIWQPLDYRAQVLFVLKGIQYPGGQYKQYNQTWESVDNLLLKDPEFGGMMKMSNPFEKEMKNIDFSSMDRKEQVRAAWKLLRSNVSWNKNYRLYCKESAKKILSEGSASNSELNFILMSMMRTLNIPAVPVVMSTRKNGLLPFTAPSFGDLTSFVICFNDGEKLCYFDASTDFFLFNTLDPNLLTKDARIINLGSQHPNKPSEEEYKKDIYSKINGYWVNFSTLGSHSTQAHIQCKIEDNKLLGNCNYSFKGIDYQDSQRRFIAANDSIDYIEKIEKDKDIVITDLDRKYNNEMLTENYDFEKKLDLNNDSLIYINPLVFKYMEENRFKESERHLPFEFNHTNIHSITTTIEIPEGYEIESLPSSVKLAVGDGNCRCSIMFGVNGNIIQTNFLFRLQSIFYEAKHYEDFKEFFTMVAEKNNSMIVLKKKSL